MGWENFEIFNRNCGLSQKRYEIGPWLLWITNRKLLVSNRSALVPVTLRDLERQDVRGHTIPADHRFYAHYLK